MSSHARIEHHVFNVRVRVFSKSSPLLVLSLLHLSPRANVYHILSTLMGRMFSRSTPCRLPQARRFFLSSGLLTRFLHLHPLPISLSPSPSPCLHLAPFLHPCPLPISLIPAPSPLTLSPSPLFPSHSPSPSHHHPCSPPLCITILLGPSPQEQVSISFPLPLTSPAPSSYLRGGSLFFSPPHPITLQSLHHPLASRPRLRNCAGKLGKYYSTSYL